MFILLVKAKVTFPSPIHTNTFNIKAYRTDNWNSWITLTSLQDQENLTQLKNKTIVPIWTKFELNLHFVSIYMCAKFHSSSLNRLNAIMYTTIRSTHTRELLYTKCMNDLLVYEEFSGLKKCQGTTSENQIIKLYDVYAVFIRFLLQDPPFNERGRYKTIKIYIYERFAKTLSTPRT